MKHATIIPSKDRSHLLLRYADLPARRFNHPIFNTKLWVSEKEYDTYKKVVDELRLEHVELIADDHSNIAECRQNILMYCHEHGYDYLFSPDDDVRFHARKSNWKVLPLELEENIELFNHMSSICSTEVPLVSLRYRFMVQNCNTAYEKNYKIIILYFVHVPTLVNNGVSFKHEGFQFYEDKYMQLQLYSKGFRSCTSSMYATSQRQPDNSEGGCFAYRNIEEANRHSRIMHEEWPEYSKLVIKNSWKEGPRLENIWYFKKFLKPDELRYFPKEQMERFMGREGAYKLEEN